MARMFKLLIGRRNKVEEAGRVMSEAVTVGVYTCTCNIHVAWEEGERRLSELVFPLSPPLPLPSHPFHEGQAAGSGGVPLDGSSSQRHSGEESQASSGQMYSVYMCIHVHVHLSVCTIVYYTCT